MILLVKLFIRKFACDNLGFDFPIIIDTINHNDPSKKFLNHLLGIIEKMITGNSGSIIFGVDYSTTKKLVN